MTLPRLYPILDTALLAKRGFPVLGAAEAMLEGGAQILQYRHKGHFSRCVYGQAQRVCELCRRFGAAFVVNDRADMARLLEAGLHVGQEDLPPAAARRILGPDGLLGFSTHNEAQLRAAEAEPVDYVALGPIFGTTSKERADPVVGLERLREWRRLTTRPLVAIGGITRENAAEVLAAGADAAAVISDLVPDPCTNTALRERIEEWKRIVR